MLPCWRCSRSIMVGGNFVILMAFLEVAKTSGSSWRHTRTASVRLHPAAWLAPPTNPSLQGSVESAACARTYGRRNEDRARRRHGEVFSTASMHRDLSASFVPLVMGGQPHETVRFNHGAKNGELVQGSCFFCRGSRRVARGFGGTKTLRAVKVPVDDPRLNTRDDGLVVDGDRASGEEMASAEYDDSSQDRKSPWGPGSGWDYWGYRVILLTVAAIWGTNFPVVMMITRSLQPQRHPLVRGVLAESDPSPLALAPVHASSYPVQMFSVAVYLLLLYFKVKFVENHAAVSNAPAAFVRFAIAAGAMLPFADWRESEVLLAGMETGIWVFVGYLTQAIGLQTSDASVCAFLCSLTVVSVPLIDALSGKGIKLITVAASLLALLGTAFLELGGAHSSWNDLWCVAQAVGFGLAFTRIEHHMNKYPGKSLQLSIGQLLSVAGLMGLWCAFSSGGNLPDFSFIRDPSVAAALGYTGLVTTSLAVWLETVALEHVPAAEMSVIFSTEPLWATLVSVAFLGERMGSNAAVGATFILLACLTAQSEQVLALLGMGGAGSTPKESDTAARNEGIADKGHNEGLIKLANQEEQENDEGVEEGQGVGENVSLPLLDELEGDGETEGGVMLEVEEPFPSGSVQDEFVPGGRRRRY